MESMVPIYIKLVLSEIKTIAEVPEEVRAAVQAEVYKVKPPVFQVPYYTGEGHGHGGFGGAGFGGA